MSGSAVVRADDSRVHFVMASLCEQVHINGNLTVVLEAESKERGRITFLIGKLTAATPYELLNTSAVPQ